mmetsp:Transcript_95051/g.273614  ORF Transcript_95051/g.273614 Transcript_95051/m.273614 type:complete len:308 (-) Transcript_95051:691-1614(-)
MQIVEVEAEPCGLLVLVDEAPDEALLVLVHHVGLGADPSAREAHRDLPGTHAAPIQQAAMDDAGLVAPVPGVVDLSVRMHQTEVFGHACRVKRHLGAILRHLHTLAVELVHVTVGNQILGQHVPGPLADDISAHVEEPLRLCRVPTHGRDHWLHVRVAYGFGEEGVALPRVVGPGGLNGAPVLLQPLEVARLHEELVNLVGGLADLPVPTEELRQRPGVRVIVLRPTQRQAPVPVLVRRREIAAGRHLHGASRCVLHTLGDEDKVRGLAIHVAEDHLRDAHRQRAVVPAEHVVKGHLAPVRVCEGHG